MKSLLRALLFACLLPLLSYSQEPELYSFLKSIPGADVVKFDSSNYKEFYILMLPQPVNHKNPGGPVFRQRIFIGHRGFDRPTIMETEGYSAGWMNPYYIDEPAGILNGNLLYVEHRYFGESKPDSLDWQYLTAEQDAADYHRIRQLFGQIYKGKWVATGVSKGGQTATEYKVFYPDDVDVTIPYVAPINYRCLDKRIDRHFRKVGTADNRKQIRDIQLFLLKNKKSCLPVYEKVSKESGFSFTLLDPETAFDYSVLELPFSFWQYTADCSQLPQLSTLSPEQAVRFLVQIVPPDNFLEYASDFGPAYYQFYHQLGYYEYNERPFRAYLKHKDYLNSDFVPKGVPVQWDPSYVKKLRQFIKAKPQRMIFIYGEADPWGATAARIKPGSGSLKEVMAHGTHGAHIGSLSASQQAEVYKALEKWLDIRLPASQSSR